MMGDALPWQPVQLIPTRPAEEFQPNANVVGIAAVPPIVNPLRYAKPIHVPRHGSATLTPIRLETMARTTAVDHL